MKYILPLLSLALVGCVSTAASDEWGSLDASVNDVSVVELVANGAKFDGWSVSVIGVLYYDHEDSLLFISKESYSLHDTASSLLVDITESVDSLGLSTDLLVALSGSYVLVEGLYAYMPREQLKANEFIVGPHYSGVVSRVTRLALVP